MVHGQNPLELKSGEECFRFKEHVFESLANSRPQWGFSIGILNDGFVNDCIDGGNCKAGAKTSDDLLRAEIPERLFLFCGLAHATNLFDTIL